MECKLPLFWPTLTRHFLHCRLKKQAVLHGGFPATNILNFERGHVFLKACSRSTKNIMASINNNYSMHVKVQGWRFDDADKWVYRGRYSNLDNRTKEDLAGDAVVKPLLGLKNYRPKIFQLVYTLTHTPHTHNTHTQTQTQDAGTASQVRDLWAIREPDYDRLRDRWVRQTRRRVSMGEWVPVNGRPLTEQEQKWLAMSTQAQV